MSDSRIGVRDNQGGEAREASRTPINPELVHRVAEVAARVSNLDVLHLANLAPLNGGRPRKLTWTRMMAASWLRVHGYSLWSIADALGVTAGTVMYYIRSVQRRCKWDPEEARQVAEMFEELEWITWKDVG